MQKLTLISFTLALGCATACAADRPYDGSMSQPAANAIPARDADNTGVNVRDRNDATETPQTQPNNEADRKLLAAVRRAVVEDENLSMSAHNAKILVNNGVVILRGPVKSSDEKSRIEKLVLTIAGVTRVENHLDIATN